MNPELRHQIKSLINDGHPLNRYFQDQLVIIERTQASIAATEASSDALDQLDYRVALDDLSRLQQVLGEEVEIARRNQQLDASAQRISVRDFGARGDGKHDDGPALRAAIAKLKEIGNGAVLFIPRGDYRIEGLHDEQVRAALMLDSLRDVRIEGERGARIIGTEIGGVLALRDCESVRVSHVALDLDPLPYTQGVIEKIDGLNIEWRLDVGFTAPDQKPFALLLDARKALSGSIRNANTGQPLGDHFGISVLKVEALDEGRFRFSTKEWKEPENQAAPLLRVGAPLCLHTRGVEGNQCALWSDNSRFCNFENVQVYASYYFAIAETHCTGCKYLHCDIVPFPGRHSGVNADGFHCISDRHGPHIEGVKVLNTMDDTGNLYGRAASVVTTLNENTIVVHANWEQADRPSGFDWQAARDWYREGDLLLLIDPDSGEPSILAKITAIAPHEWNGRRITALTLDAALPTLKTRESLGHTELLADSAGFLYHDQEVAVEQFAINISTKSDGFVIRDCHMGRNTVTAWKIKASNGIFANNRFEQHGWCCISLFMELMWQEGFVPRNILIEDNVFENRYGIWTGCGYPKHGTFGPAWLRGITIRNNEFRHNKSGWSLGLNHLRQGEVTGNIMPTSRPIEIHGQTRGVSIAGNFYTVSPPPAPHIEPGASGVEVAEHNV
jgi:hypothetical protein